MVKSLTSCQCKIHPKEISSKEKRIKGICREIQEEMKMTGLVQKARTSQFPKARVIMKYKLAKNMWMKKNFRLKKPKHPVFHFFSCSLRVVLLLGCFLSWINGYGSKLSTF